MIDLNRCMSATCMGGFGSFFLGERDREVSGHMVGEGERLGSVGTWCASAFLLILLFTLWQSSFIF